MKLSPNYEVMIEIITKVSTYSLKRISAYGQAHSHAIS